MIKDLPGCLQKDFIFRFSKILQVDLSSKCFQVGQILYKVAEDCGFMLAY